jgi:hypothetical protein
MNQPIPYDIQALAVECAATNQRAAFERRSDLADRGKWNKDLLPGDDRLATELAAAAVTMRRIADKARERDEARP